MFCTDSANWPVREWGVVKPSQAYKEVFSVYKHTLPNGAEIAFREPKAQDRRELLRRVHPNDPSVDHDALLAAMCVLRINGQEPMDPDPMYTLDQLGLKDSQEYVNLFLLMFTLNQDDMSRIREAAKKLLSPASAPSSEPN